MSKPINSYFNLFKEYSQPWEPSWSFDDAGMREFIIDYNLKEAIINLDYNTIEEAFAQSISNCEVIEDRIVLSATLNHCIKTNYFKGSLIKWMTDCTN